MASVEYELKLQRQFAKERARLKASVNGNLAAFRSLCLKEGITFHYDRSADTLYVFPGSAPREAFTQLLSGNVYARFDPDTEDIVGFEIVDFRGNPPASPAGSEPLDFLGAVMDRYGIVTHISPQARADLIVADCLTSSDRAFTEDLSIIGAILAGLPFPSIPVEVNDEPATLGVDGILGFDFFARFFTEVIFAFPPTG